MKHRWLVLLLFIFTFLSFIVAMMFGVAHYPPAEVVGSIFTAGASEGDSAILYEIRLPRVLAAFLAGLMISISGLVMQTVTHNDLSEPSILGVNAGANFAIVISTLLVPALSFTGMLIGGFAGGLLVGVVILFVTRFKSPIHLILAGAGISLFLYAMTDFLVITNNLGQYLAFFTSGGAAGVSLAQLGVIAPVALIIISVLYVLAKELDVFLFGDEMAASLGQNHKVYQVVTLVCAIMLASMSVAIVGNVVFLGLLVPHIVKMIAGYMHRLTIFYTGIFGGALFMLSDMAARMLNETPVNAIIAMIGLPFFIYIIRTRGRKYA